MLIPFSQAILGAILGHGHPIYLRKFQSFQFPLSGMTYAAPDCPFAQSGCSRLCVAMKPWPFQVLSWWRTWSLQRGSCRPEAFQQFGEGPGTVGNGEHANLHKLNFLKPRDILKPLEATWNRVPWATSQKPWPSPSNAGMICAECPTGAVCRVEVNSNYQAPASYIKVIFSGPYGAKMELNRFDMVWLCCVCCLQSRAPGMTWTGSECTACDPSTSFLWWSLVQQSGTATSPCWLRKTVPFLSLLVKWLTARSLFWLWTFVERM